MNLRQKAVRGVVWSAAQIWGTNLTSFLTFLVLSRILDSQAFGLMAIAEVYRAFIQIFLYQGFSSAIVQRADLKPGHLDTAFWANVLMGVLLAVLGVIGSRFVAALFDEPQLAPIVAWLSLGFVLNSLRGTQSAILSRELAFKRLAARSLAAIIAGGIVGIAMAFAGFGVWSLVAQDLAGSAVGVVILWRVSDWRPGFNVSWKYFTDLFSFGINIVGTNLLDFFNRRSDDLLIGYYLGAVALGYYTIAYRLLLVMVNLLTRVTTAVAYPTFSRLQTEPERMRRAFYAVTQMTSLVAFPCFFGMALLAPELVPVLFGAQWQPSVPVMQILAFVGMLQSVQFFNGTVIRAAGKPSWILAIMSVNAVANIVGFSLTVQWGIVAVAGSFLVVSYLLAPLPLLAVRRLIAIDFRTYFRQYQAPLGGCITIAATVWGLQYVLGTQLNLQVRLVTYVLAGALAYLATIQLTAPTLSRQALKLARSALPGARLSKRGREEVENERAKA